MNLEISIIDRKSGEIVYKDSLINSGPVDKWKDWNFLTFDFTPFKEIGQYYLFFTIENKHIKSETFDIREDILIENTLSLTVPAL